MTEHKGLPVHGYVPQDDKKVSLVNANKELEERCLRQFGAISVNANVNADARWLAIAKTHLEMAFMAANRAIFQPTRISLPEDTGLPHAIPEDGANV